MPMFYIPQPRRFHYQPRFYDPEKERWEALKAKHAIESEDTAAPEEERLTDTDITQTPGNDDELAYFQERVRRFDELSTHQKSKLTWRDMFRRREMPEFHYEPRFISEGVTPERKPDNAAERIEEARQRSIRIKRRFDVQRTLQRKQQSVWIKVALVLMVFYLIYRFYGPIMQFLLKLFF